MAYQVRDSNGALRESTTGGPCPLLGFVYQLHCPLPPRWVVELTGREPNGAYEALIDIEPVTNSVEGYQIESRPAPGR